MKLAATLQIILLVLGKLNPNNGSIYIFHKLRVNFLL
jgi:hypothetical protein